MPRARTPARPAAPLTTQVMPPPWPPAPTPPPPPPALAMARLLRFRGLRPPLRRPPAARPLLRARTDRAPAAAPSGAAPRAPSPSPGRTPGRARGGRAARRPQTRGARPRRPGLARLWRRRRRSGSAEAGGGRRRGLLAGPRPRVRAASAAGSRASGRGGGGGAGTRGGALSSPPACGGRLLGSWSEVAAEAEAAYVGRSSSPTSSQPSPRRSQRSRRGRGRLPPVRYNTAHTRTQEGWGRPAGRGRASGLPRCHSRRGAHRGPVAASAYPGLRRRGGDRGGNVIAGSNRREDLGFLLCVRV